MISFDANPSFYAFTARAPHAKRRIHLWVDEERCVLFRPKNAPPDWLGALWGAHLRLIYALGSGQHARALQRAESPLRSSHFFRVFDFDDPREGKTRKWRVLWRPDFGCVAPLGCPDLQGAYFWPRSAKLSLWKTPTAVLKRHFEREWNDPNSDVRAALPWCEWDYEEREIRAIRWKRGDLDGLREVVDAALKLAPWDESEPNNQRVMSANWTDDTPLSIEFCSQESAEFFVVFKRFKAVVETKFESVYDLPNGTRDDWILPWETIEPPRSRHHGVGMWFKIEAPPTQHERLEATLLLRDWLEQNAPELLGDWFSAGKMLNDPS